MSPLELYDLGLLHGGDVVVRERGGTVRRLPLDLWTCEQQSGDDTLVRRCRGAVLDLGCGPGRLTVAVARTGLPAVGVDLAPGAVAVARARGALVLPGCVFGVLPAVGRWATVLLADGNIGIGGDPERLLARARQLLTDDGRVLVELLPPSTPSRVVDVRLERGGRTSSWFRWAEVGADDVAALATSCGLYVDERWHDGDRHFAALGVAAAETAPVT